MPVADWNERSRMSFQARALRMSGMTRPTAMRSQPIASMLSGVTTGTFAGLTPVPEVGVGVAAVIAVVVVAVGCALTDVAAGGVILAAGVIGPPAKVKIPCARIAASTTVTANYSGFSVSAGVTRYQWPSHIAVITPPSARAAAKNSATVNALPKTASPSGR